ncbi:Toxin-antitoxin system, antitoxin component, CopG-like [Desulfonema limicola]|uniref:Toxin-antitoxin system, antitoxin component, CopG-like n=1 Tax=Desulfonema limicola TaxID=45656 RepID=A0A975GGD0_9BACT|nr:CopG family antitoxin [Desulfonema limicola]QTA80186.1 Toxin-antitoxin system, antitoxin component, CopG-like [Desulfonema limicola]
MNQIKTIPKTDSIKELEQFWDTHDLTDYEDQLEEVADTVFESKNTIRIDLDVDEAETIKRIALKKGIPYQILVKEWVLDKVRAA